MGGVGGGRHLGALLGLPWAGSARFAAVTARRGASCGRLGAQTEAPEDPVRVAGAPRGAPRGGDPRMTRLLVVHPCGLRTDGTITCRGWNEWGQATAPAGQLSAVAAAGRR